MYALNKMFYNIFSGFGVIFALVNEREQMFLGLTTSSLFIKGRTFKTK